MTSDPDHSRPPLPAGPCPEPNAVEQERLIDQDFEDAVQWHLAHDPAFQNLDIEFDISSPPPPPSVLDQTLALGRAWKRKREERRKSERDKAKALRPAPKTDAERQQAKRDRDRVQQPDPAPRPLDPTVRAQIKSEAYDRLTTLRGAVATASASERRLRRMAGRELDYTKAWMAREVLRATGVPYSLQSVADELNKRKSTESERQAVRRLLQQVKVLEELGIWTPFNPSSASSGTTPSGS